MSGKHILFLSVLVAFVVPASAVNFLTNGDFDTGDYEGWYTYIENSNAAWIEMETSFTYDGTPCSVMYVSEEWPGAVIGQEVSFDPNTIPTLDFSCVVNTQWTTWGTAGVELNYYEPNDTYVAWDSFLFFDGSDGIPTEWTSYSHIFAVPPKAGKVDVVIRASNWASGVYYDNVSLGYTSQDQAELLYPPVGVTIPWQDPTNCGNGARLKWIAAQDATGDHYVYFGMNEEDVAYATVSDSEYQGAVALSEPNYVLSLDDVDKGGVYYWRVDETVGGQVVRGALIGSFRVSPETEVDSLDYESNSNLQAVWGSNATLDSDAMRIMYNNSAAPFMTEVRADVSGLRVCSTDWTFGSNALLMLDIKGHDDMTDSVYVKLESNLGLQSGRVDYPDLHALNQQSYELLRTWVIDLGEFEDQGVDLMNVTALVIGVGEGSVAGGSGSVLIDNIRLSVPACLADMIPEDINNDCVVDMLDLELLAGNWLAKGYNVEASVPPRGPVLWYKFDDSSGAVAADSSGFGYNGNINRADSWAVAPSGYDGSGCLELDNDTWVEVPVDAANIGDPNYPSPDDPAQYLGAESTISLWINDSGQVDSDSMLFEIGGQASIWLGATGDFSLNMGGNDLRWGVANYSNADHPQDEWVHYAFVKSAGAGYIRIYQNGSLITEMAADGTWSPVVDDVDTFFSIGAWRWSGGNGGYHDGLMDDFRLYDYALTQAEVLSLAVAGQTATSPLIQSLITPSDVIEDSSVDLNDFAAVASEWLQDVVYP